MLSTSNALYALPSLALFMVLIPYTGLGNLTVIIPLTIFSLCVLLPDVVDGLRGVPEPVRQAATAMGFSPLRRLALVELPIAIPVVMAGLRVKLTTKDLLKMDKEIVIDHQNYSTVAGNWLSQAGIKQPGSAPPGHRNRWPGRRDDRRPGQRAVRGRSAGPQIDHRPRATASTPAAMMER